MGNCIVTQLPGIVQNENLEQLGIVRGTVMASLQTPYAIIRFDQGGYNLSPGDVATLEIANKDAAYFRPYNGNPTDKVTITSETNLPIYLEKKEGFSGDSFDILYSKYILPRFYNANENFDFKTLRYSKGITIIESNGSFSLEDMQAIEANSNGGVKKFLAVFSNSRRLIGETSALAPLVHLNELMTYGCNITGNWNELFDTWAANGKTGELACSIYNCPAICSGELAPYASASNPLFTVTFANGSWHVNS